MANVTRDAINLTEQVRRIDGLEKRLSSAVPKQVFYGTGDGSTVDFELPKGWNPLLVFDGGSLLKEASGAGYWSKSSTGFVWKITFGTAPTSGNVLAWLCERVAQ